VIFNIVFDFYVCIIFDSCLLGFAPMGCRISFWFFVLVVLLLWAVYRDLLFFCPCGSSLVRLGVLLNR